MYSSLDDEDNNNNNESNVIIEKEVIEGKETNDNNNEDEVQITSEGIIQVSSEKIQRKSYNTNKKQLSVMPTLYKRGSLEDLDQQQKEHNHRMMLHQLIEWLNKGEPLRKHGRKGKPHTRWIAVSVARDRIFWNSSLTIGYITLTHIKNIVAGKTTDVFKRKPAVDVSDDLCFSIITDERTLDLECKTKEQRDKWLHALQYVLKTLKRKEQAHFLKMQRAKARRQRRLSEDRFKSIDMHSIQLKRKDDEDIIKMLSAHHDKADIEKINKQWIERNKINLYNRPYRANKLGSHDDIVLNESPKKKNKKQFLFPPHGKEQNRALARQFRHSDIG